MSLDLARTVADAVLYEGYLLYPYRATSRKNQARWQFGVLGPPQAATDGLGEEAGMAAQCLLNTRLWITRLHGPPQSEMVADPTVTVHLRFLQLQLRNLERAEPGAGGTPAEFQPVPELTVDGQLMYSWDEAVEHEVVLPGYSISDLTAGISYPVTIDGGEDTEPLHTEVGSLAGRVVRRRSPLHAEVTAQITQVGDYARLTIAVQNTAASRAHTKDDAIRTALIGTHLLIEASGADFVSLLEPPDDAVTAAATCQQRRCWPVLAGPNGSSDVVLASPIILYDYPEVAAESAGALFDSTEIDEILSLRVMTMTDEEKAEAKATDPRAGEIIDRCEQMTVDELQQLHGILRDPHAEATLVATAETIPEGFADAIAAVKADEQLPWFETGDVPWWDPAADERVQPEVDAVVIDGVSVSKGSRVRVHPSRRADAQDLFFADQEARVTAVLTDVDGATHVALVLVDDPAAELHDWYGRYLYFAPDELEPLPAQPVSDSQKESRP